VSTRNRPADDRGAAVVIALLMMILLAIVGAALLTLTNTETLISASYRYAHETSYGADAALERALLDLDVISDWSTVVAAPPSNIRSGLDDGAGSPRGPDGRNLNLAGLTAARQRESDDRDGPAVFGADAPQWRLFGHAPIEDLLGTAEPAPPVYLLVWVADDGMDGDGDPSRDANGRIVVYAQALGGGGSRRAVEAALGRSGNGALAVLGWHRSR
jgi:hypothetical protein